MTRRTFSELHPIAYNIAAYRKQFQRHVANALASRRKVLAERKDQELLPVVAYKHNSLIRRRLGNVDQHLQEGKARSLAVAAPTINNIIIAPGQTFSLWHLVGKPSQQRGFGTGLVISNGAPAAGLGGGMCQLSNLIHWMVLHTPLDIVEHHHHSDLDLFPDFNRQIPFGTGTSVAYNYLDYRFHNPTDRTFQLRVFVDDEYLRGEIRVDEALSVKFHVVEEDAFFYRATMSDGKPEVRRHNTIWRLTRCKRTGDIINREFILENDAHTCYDESHIKQPIRPSKNDLGDNELLAA